MLLCFGEAIDGDYLVGLGKSQILWRTLLRIMHLTNFELNLQAKPTSQAQ